MNAAPSVTFALDGEGIGWIVFDDPASRANVFNEATQSAFADALTAAEKSGARALVVMSAKDTIFIAGADLRWLGSLPDAATATAFARRGQDLFARVAQARIPVVAAIHGACAGGGFELALACHWRIATDDAATQIGLPETGIGTIPGWGGCVRLPRLIGAQPALAHILRAQLVSAAEALREGLVNEVVPGAALKDRARAAARRLASEGRPALPLPPALPTDHFAELRDATLARTRGRQPAPMAAIDAVEQTLDLPEATALPIEARIFGAVTADDVCRNLIHAFLLREAARKRTLGGWFPVAAAKASAPPIRTVGVVGAGVMGSGIAHWLASHGMDVILRDVSPEAIGRGLQVVRRLFDDSVKSGRQTPGAAADALARIRATLTWDGFAGCDLVIEAIVEDVAAKRALFTELASVVRPETLLASNTSALPIEDLMQGVPGPGRALGIHFFNPVSRMALVELVLAKETTAVTAQRALTLVKGLRKSPVICRSAPGFLVTRVLFFYLNAAVRQWELGRTTVEIDSALRDFGWPMGPLRLIDEVGIDVTDFIFGEMTHYYPDRFRRSTACSRLLAAGLLGRKNGASRGFYRYEDGREHNNETETRHVVSAAGRELRAGTEDRQRVDLTDHLMTIMIDEARRCLDEGVVKTSEDVDFALLAGAGFPAFRGGLMRYAAQRAATAESPSHSNPLLPQPLTRAPANTS